MSKPNSIKKANERFNKKLQAYESEQTHRLKVKEILVTMISKAMYSEADTVTFDPTAKLKGFNFDIPQAAHSLNELYLNKYLALLPKKREATQHQVLCPDGRPGCAVFHAEYRLSPEDKIYNQAIEEARKAFKEDDNGQE